MDLTLRKNILLQFLIAGIDESHFTQGLNGLELGFKSYDQFVNYQTQLISQFNEVSISTLEFIINKIVPIAKVVDRPSMNTYSVAGLVFDSSANIVFYDRKP